MNFDRGTKHFAGYSTGVRNILEIDIWGYETFPTLHKNKGTKQSKKMFCAKHFSWFCSGRNIFHLLSHFFNSKIVRLKALANKKMIKLKCSCMIFTNKIEIGFVLPIFFKLGTQHYPPYILYGLFQAITLFAFSSRSIIFDLYCWDYRRG